jgi:hypothetical protein
MRRTYADGKVLKTIEKLRENTLLYFTERKADVAHRIALAALALFVVHQGSR